MISRLHTSCKECIFAIYDESNKTQVGCKLEKLDKLKDNGVEVIETFDEEKEFYVLNNHACMTYRNKLMEDKTLDEQMEIVKQQAKPRMACIILIQNNNESDLENTIKSLVEQEEQFREVIFTNLSDIKPSVIIDLINKHEGKFKWSVKQILDEYWIGSKSINHALEKSRSTYACIFNSGFIINKFFVKEIIDALCNQMKRFIMLKGIDEKDNGLTVQTYAFLSLRGNEEANTDDEQGASVNSFLEKISYIASTQNMFHLIKNCEEICPCMKKQ